MGLGWEERISKRRERTNEGESKSKREQERVSKQEREGKRERLKEGMRKLVNRRRKEGGRKDIMMVNMTYRLYLRPKSSRANSDYQ